MSKYNNQSEAQVEQKQRVDDQQLALSVQEKSYHPSGCVGTPARED